MATAKAERLLNLVIALVNSPRYRTAAWIREKVAGYGDAPTEEAFFRTFERDKQELRESGIPVQTDGADGYRIVAGELTLPELSFTPDETAALALAGRLWSTTALDRAGAGALRKIRDAGPGQQADEPDEFAAADLLQPRVRTGDPAFEPLFAAVRARRAVQFGYRRDPGRPPVTRTVEPYGLVSYHGRWYVIGHDRDRGEQRTFRLSRITEPVSAIGRAGAVRVPPGIDLMAQVRASVRQAPDRSATVLVRPGRAVGLRRSAVAVHSEPGITDTAEPGPEVGRLPGDWDRLSIPMSGLWSTAQRIAGHGPDVVVLEPEDLRTAVVRLLRGARAAGRPAGTERT
ncbi:WYL domain-containing protein [Nakamurella flava]|uniref:WYL domain-containing protein n=1 Tax=Nakamurella flava TaxID=2576308 RepID=A0A4U6QJM2_9ACTN|nr:WYL domain-containing protein [Nakamurella flava]TKV60670.1 WYL domain-containing protein [Nakamurella flava]